MPVSSGSNHSKVSYQKTKITSGKELWEHTLMLSKTDKESFEGGLQDWYLKWKWFLDEQKTDVNGKSRYIHKKLRSAYRSVKNNLSWLFVWHDNPQLNMPNTTNAIDGSFADLKNKLRNHNGLSIRPKKHHKCPLLRKSQSNTLTIPEIATTCFGQLKEGKYLL